MKLDTWTGYLNSISFNRFLPLAGDQPQTTTPSEKAHWFEPTTKLPFLYTLAGPTPRGPGPPISKFSFLKKAVFLFTSKFAPPLINARPPYCSGAGTAS